MERFNIQVTICKASMYSRPIHVGTVADKIAPERLTSLLASVLFHKTDNIRLT